MDGREEGTTRRKIFAGPGTRGLHNHAVGFQPSFRRDSLTNFWTTSSVIRRLEKKGAGGVV